MSSNLESILKTIQTEKELSVKPENIRYGTKIFDVHGSLKPVTLNGGDSSMAIYLQDETPVLPEGIWINTDKTYENIYLEDELHTEEHSVVYSERTEDDDSNMIKGRTVPEDLYNATYCQRGNKFHFFGYYSSTTNYNTTEKIHRHYTYDYDTDAWVKLSDCPTPQGGTAAEWIDEDTIYIFGSIHANYKLYVYKYTISTDTWERLDDISAEGYNGSYNTYSCYDRDNNVIYLANCYNLYKYDILTGEYTTLYTLTSGNYIISGYIALYKNYIIFSHLYSNTVYIKAYDIINKTIKNLDTNSRVYNAVGDTYISMLLVGNRLYFTSTSKTGYKIAYAKLSDTLGTLNPTSINATSFAVKYGIGAITTPEGVDIILNFKSTNEGYMKALRLYDKEYNFDKNTLLIYGNNAGQYKTQFYINQKIINDARWCQTFANVYLYDAENTTMLKTLPRYYGDGTNWIQIQ